jgi:L-aspartate oxidase
MQTDVLIIGSGIAGATAALALSEDRQREITVITRAEKPAESNSSWAQGGIAGLGTDDTPQLLAEDVLRAGAGLSYRPAVEILVEEGPRLLLELLQEKVGVAFDRGEDGQIAYGLEGAHSRRRILHVGDLTGKAVMDALLDQVASRPNITLLPGHTAVDLLTFPHHSRDPLSVYGDPRCHGVYAYDQRKRYVEVIVAGQVILATGGLGQIYLNTTNPPGSRGDGLAMAYRAGARVINAEYVQFHPTALHMPGTTKTLISEAVRGEGALLLTPEGRRFMERYEPGQLELAPRDVVARAIYTEMLAHGYPYVMLDIASVKSPEEIRERFPRIHAACQAQGIDMTRQPIPVVPATHYHCGGVHVDLWGRTTLPGLYAVGEVSCTGVHGANRLASTSLLEGIVWGARAARNILEGPGAAPLDEGLVPPWDESGLSFHADPALIQGDLQTIRNLMWHYVGLRRTRYRLKRAIRELRNLWLNIEEFYRKVYLIDDLIGLRNTALAALVVAGAALENPTSRGCHYREDGHRANGAVPPHGNRSLELESPGSSQGGPSSS